ncbi:MAG: glycosyltransferase family 4 protein, partial [Proteobacteria bacterium]|nr:glycosyltransferase family 4 protein [Pseudomonadota bacterium]
VHDCSPIAFPGLYAPLERATLAFLMTAASRRASRVLTLSESVAREAGVLLPVSPAKIQVTGPGVGPAYSRAGRLSAGPPARLPGLPADFLLYAGTARKNKNLDRLLDAVAILEISHGLAAPLVLAGRAHDRADRLLARARGLGIAGRVHFTGYVAPGVLAGLYRTARAVVCPSMYEGFGLPVLEAMACGAAVAASQNLSEAAGGAAELFDPSGPGDMARVLARVWTDKALRQDLSERGLARTRGLSWDRPAARVLAALVEAAE